jgi:hypothetical protein
VLSSLLGLSNDAAAFAALMRTSAVQRCATMLCKRSPPARRPLAARSPRARSLKEPTDGSPCGRLRGSVIDLIECERMADESASTKPDARGTQLQQAVQVLLQLLIHDADGDLLALVVDHPAVEDLGLARQAKLGELARICHSQGTEVEGVDALSRAEDHS